MRQLIKSVIKRTTFNLVSLANSSKIGRFINYEFIKSVLQLQKTVIHNGCSLDLVIPNLINKFRADTFSSKEPETLVWIDSIPIGSVFWDIGANVGLYSCYAAKKRRCKVLSFEPSVFNLESLARNIFINDLMDKITIVPLPLSNKLEVSSLNMSSTDWGGALSTFGQSYGHDGNDLEKIFEFKTIGLSMDDAVQRLDIPSPDYIKMDVDGIEHLILKGGSRVLLEVAGILIEVNEDYKEQDDNVFEYLTEAGLVLKEKRHSDMFEGNIVFGNSYNQIWVRQG